MNKRENENGGAGGWGKRKDSSLSFYQPSLVEEEGRASKRRREREGGYLGGAKSEALRKVQTAGEAFNLSPGTPRYLCDSILEAEYRTPVTKG